MKIFANFSITILVGLAASTAIRQHAPGIEVRLRSVGNSGIKATIKNTGSESLRLLKEGTILDHAPVQKLHVKSKDGRVTFEGIRKRVNHNALSDTAFTSLAGGKSMEIHVEMASIHDLSSGGAYTVTSSGRIPFAEKGSNSLKGAFSYQSNDVVVHVNGHQASKVPKALRAKKHSERSLVSDCGGDQYTTAELAQTDCDWLATEAAYQALNGDVGKFEAYWGTSDASVRQTVAARYSAVAQECSTSPSSGLTTTHCTDMYSQCTQDVLAYTMPSEGTIVNCPLYFSLLPTVTDACHNQDQATTTIHEMTHADAVYYPGTEDYCYGFDDCMNISSDQRVQAADMYAIYANAIYTNC